MCWLGLRLNIRRCWGLSRFLVQPLALPPHVLRRRRPPPDSRIPTTPPVSLPPGIQSPFAQDADNSSAGFRAVDCPMRLRVEDALSCRREDDSDWFDAWRVQLCCQASRRDALPARLYPDWEQNQSIPAAISFAAGPSLRRDHWNNRPSDRLQLLSWNPGPFRGLDPNLLASHLNGPWHVVCVQGGADFCHDKSLQDNFCVVTQHNCAVVPNKNIFEPRFSCVPLFVHCELKYSTWAVEGMVATGKFRRAPDRSCSYSTVANVRVINESAKRRSVCNASATCVSRSARSCSPVT